MLMHTHQFVQQHIDDLSISMVCLGEIVSHWEKFCIFADNGSNEDSGLSNAFGKEKGRR